MAYWGQNEDTIREADVVLVTAKFKDDPIVGQNGNCGLDPQGGPLPGVLETLARDTHAKYGKVAFNIPPSVGCRNIWCDIVYLDEALCHGVNLASAEYDFFDSECACMVVQSTDEISDFVTDGCLPRLIPDDEFAAPNCPALPGGYPEALDFEYCALPRLDRFEEAENAFFKFRRETTSCARDGQGNIVRVEITSKQLPLSVQWTDVLPLGSNHTLLSGTPTDTLVFTSVGETIVREYVVKTGPGAVDDQITGSAQVVGQPATNINLNSDTIVIDPNCPTLCFTGFGSQNATVFGKLFYAGGGRFDRTLPADIGLFIKMYAGQGSAGKSAREHFITASVAVPAFAASQVFSVAPSAFTGFAVGLPVWVFNSCFVTNPQRKITCLDIEAEEGKPNPDEEITGLYGTITALDVVGGTVTVTFNVPPDAITDFATTAKATIMVAPDNSKGFYWEASPGLVSLCGVPLGPPDSHCILRWNYKFWNSTQNPCPTTLGAGFICDGDGGSFAYELFGELPKDILNPVDWIDLWCSPMSEVLISQDVALTDGVIEVCDICPFEECDIIQLVDTACSGREGNGPGFVTSVVATAPLNGGESCAVEKAVKGNITLGDPVPNTIVGCPGFDGFKTTRKSRAFIKPDVCRFAFSVTTSCDQDGCPVVCGDPAPESVCVDFDLGKFTWDESVALRNPLICFRTLDVSIDIPLVQGIYFLRSLDKCGCKSPPSKPIRMPDPKPPIGAAPFSPTVSFFAETLGDFSAAGANPIPGTLVGFTLSQTKKCKISMGSGGFQHVFVGNLGEAFIRIDGATTIRVGRVLGSDGGDTLVDTGQADGFAFLDLAPGPHTVEAFTTMNFGGITVFGPIKILVEF